MAERKVHYTITADSKRAEESFQKLETKAQRLKSSIFSIAGRYLSVTAAIGIATKSLNEYMESEARNLRLQQTLINTRNYSIQQYQQLIDFTQQAQRELAIEDDRVVDLIQTLLGFGTPAALVKDLARATIDLATFLGIDLNSAAMLVGKTMEGTINPLRRYGIELKNAKDETERASLIIKQAMERWGGITETTMSGIKGAFERLKYDIGNIMEGIGNFLAQGIYGIIDTFNFLFHALTFQTDKWFLDYSNKWAEYSRFLASQTERTLTSVVFQNAKKLASTFSNAEIKKSIKWYEDEIRRLELSLSMMITHGGAEREESIRKQILLLSEEKRAFEEILENNKSNENVLEKILDREKTKIQLKEVEVKLGKSNYEDLLETLLLSERNVKNAEKLAKTDKEKLEILNQELDIREKIKDVLPEITKRQIKMIEPLKLYESVFEKVEKIKKSLMQPVEVPELPQIDDKLNDYEMAWRNTWYDVIWYIGGEFNKMWNKVFGEANSLLEVFAQSFLNAMVEILAKMAIVETLSFLGLPVPIFHSGGIAKAHRGLLTRDEVPIVARKGEMILTPQQQSNLFNLLQTGSKRAETTQNIYLIVDGEKLVNKTLKNRLPSLMNKLNYVMR